MKVLILAAGYATRLYPHTKNFSKPLLRINKKPIIEYLTDKLESIDGICEIIVVTNDRFFNDFRRWRDGLSRKNKVTIVNDLTRSPKEKLGAIGDMNLVFDKKRSADDFLILGGDNFFAEPLDGFILQARKNAPAITIGVCDIKNKKEAGNYGVVGLGRNSRIINFQEKPAHPESSLIAMCLYYFPRQALDFIKKYLDNPKNPKDAVGSYINWLSKNKTVYAFIFKSFWFDIGHLHTYKKVKELTKGAR
jgi:glucose-1-phosphate thymidylyltransferase